MSSPNCPRNLRYRIAYVLVAYGALYYDCISTGYSSMLKKLRKVVELMNVPT
jgi:hypothetical protein